MLKLERNQKLPISPDMVRLIGHTPMVELKKIGRDLPEKFSQNSNSTIHVPA